MIVKNISAESYAINKSVQIDVNTPDPNDGLILAGQTLDLSLSINDTELLASEQLNDGLVAGILVLVVEGDELSQNRSLEIYHAGAGEWANIYDTAVSESNLRAGIAQGFIYAINCKIG